MKWSIGALALLTLASSAPAARAQTLTWASPVTFDHGGQTAAATNGTGAGYEVAGHLGGAGGYYTDFDIWYDGSTWGSSSWNGGYEVPPSSNNVVGYSLGASGDPTSSSLLYSFMFGNMAQSNGVSYVNYQTGTFNTGNNSLNFGSGYGYWTTASHGFYPAVAQGTTNGQMYFFLVENGTDENLTPSIPTSAIQFQWGTLNSDGVSIDWRNQWYGSNIGTGYHPSIAMWPINSNTFFIAVAYEGSDSDSNQNLTMKVGQWTVGNSVPTWYNTYTYGYGYAPSVAVCARNRSPAVLMEVHSEFSSYYGYAQGVYQWGDIEGGWQTWPSTTSGYLSSGGQVDFPSVACNTYWGFESHNTSVGGNVQTTKFSFN